MVGYHCVDLIKIHRQHFQNGEKFLRKAVGFYKDADSVIMPCRKAGIFGAGTGTFDSHISGCHVAAQLFAGIALKSTFCAVVDLDHV